MTDNLEELERLLVKATPGPWESIAEVGVENFANSIYAPAGDWDGLLLARVDQNGSTENAALIVALRNAAPSLIATAREVEGLRAEVARLTEACDLWAWLGTNKNIELRHSRWDDEVFQWEVYSVNGGRNDQEWTLRGAGETPFEAIKAARAALAGKGG